MQVACSPHVFRYSGFQRMSLTMALTPGSGLLLDMYKFTGCFLLNLNW